MKILFINNDTKRLLEFRNLLSDYDLTVINHGEVKNTPIDEFDLVVLSGSSVNSVVGNDDIYVGELDLIRESIKPIIGICLGFQLIVHAYGGNLLRRSSKINGLKSIEATKDDVIFGGEKRFTVYESHSWVVTELSPIFEGLAQSEYGWEVIKHKEKPIYGMQFHPEVIENNYDDGSKIFANIIKKFI